MRVGPECPPLTRCVWEGIFLSSLVRLLCVLAYKLGVHAVVYRLGGDLATVSEESAFIEIPLTLLHPFLPIACILAFALDLLRMGFRSTFQLLQTLVFRTARADALGNSRYGRLLECSRRLPWRGRR